MSPVSITVRPVDSNRTDPVARQPDQTANNPKLAHLFYLALLTLATHWMLLLNDGLYLEDWGLYPALRYGDWNAIIDMFSSAGVPTSVLYVLPLSLFVNVLFFKAINFALILASAALTYLIGLESKLVSRGEAFWIAAMFVLVPVYTVYVIFTYYYYLIGYVLFLAGTYAFLKMYSARSLWRWPLRATAIVLYVLSFNINSLLVYYLAALALFFLVDRQRTPTFSAVDGGLVHGLGTFARKHADFMLLPFAYWAAKKAFTPAHGIYSSYNAFDFQAAALVRNLANFLHNGLVTPLGPALVAAIVLCGALAAAGRLTWRKSSAGGRDSHARAGTPPDRSAQLLLFGAVVFVAGIFPYCAVGKSPEPGVLMRHTLLVPLPIGMMLVGVWGLLGRTVVLSQSAGAIVLVVFALFLEIGWWRSYLGWEARAAKDSAITFHLREHPEWSRYAVYWVDDRYPIRGAENEYNFQEFTARFRMLWGGQTRMAFTPAHIGFFGVESPPGVSPVRARMDTIRKFCNSWASAKDIDLTGSQAILRIEPGRVAPGPAALAGQYMYYRFLASGGFDDFLRSIVTVTVFGVP